jgi:hypothetical protein
VSLAFEASLPSLRREDGRSRDMRSVADRKVTGFTNGEEEAVGLTRSS